MARVSFSVTAKKAISRLYIKRAFSYFFIYFFFLNLAKRFPNTMMDQTQILDPNYYAAASTVSANIIPTASTSTHIPFDQYQQQQPQASHHPQAYIYGDPQQQQLQQQQQQQQYPTIDFFYETPHIQPTPSSSHTYTTTTATNTINTIIPTASTSYQTPMVNASIRTARLTWCVTSLFNLCRLQNHWTVIVLLEQQQQQHPRLYREWTKTMCKI